ncbi:MAG: phycobilisome degradation family protein [Leptolyngbyaceae cyanobacterium RU_5_1]|nr:phycobilisome degradation family protein [Leptolyngbyaceae cyanobacterium RU_5_1]
MNQALELTLEQEFSLRCFADKVQQMSHKQAHEFLIEQYRLMMLQETMYQNLLKHEWKLDGDLASFQTEK